MKRVLRPSLDPANFDPEAEQADEASRAWRGGALFALIVAAGIALMILSNSPAPAPTSARTIGWKSWDEARDLPVDRAADRPTLVLFTAAWCPGCRAFESDVLARPDVAQHLATRYALLRVDMTRRDSPNQALGKQYHIEVYPTLILYNSAGGEVARCYGLSATDLMLWLKTDGQAIKQYIE